MTDDSLYADVILPLPIPRDYTYAIPPALRRTILPGVRVLVQFGAKRILTAVVKKVHSVQPEVYQAKDILEVLDQEPVVNTYQLKLFEWIADYYLCCTGEVLNAAMPSGLKLNSESRLQLNPDFDSDVPFAQEEMQIIEAIEKFGSVSYKELPKLTGIKSGLKFVKSLLEKKKILLFEEVKEKYTPKKVRKIRLHQDYCNQIKLKELFELLHKKPKQTDLLLKFLSIAPLSKPELNEKGIDKTYFKELTNSETALRSLVKEGIFEEITETVPRFPAPDNSELILPKLTDFQNNTKSEILKNFEEKDIVLLHGITGSGKTEIYIDLIAKALDGGGQVLLMLPEIALTTQIVNRLSRVFKNKMGVYHSKFSDNERVEVYSGVLSGKYNFIVGVRSSIFLPFENLSLVIIDEEHESSYKQHDPAPRYHARDAALVLAKIHNAKTLLGSATPSIESYYHCMENKWGLVELTRRYSEGQLPEIILSDLKKERKSKTMKNDFSSVLIKATEFALSHQEQIILFQNRRGFAPYLNCEECGFVFVCKHCDVSMTFHLNANELRCHYCGNYQSPPSCCSACGSTNVKTSGFGTEKIEEDLKIFFPDTVVARMDLDTTRKKNAYQGLIEEFETGKTNILVGTQMVTKGLDFSNVTLVGIFDADRLLYFPDFRSHEKTFQTLVQVSGRAGRTNAKGKVIIQTSSPDHYIYKFVIQNDYKGFYNQEIEERKKFFYPPFSRMIKLTIKNEHQQNAQDIAKRLHKMLLSQLGRERVLGPEIPPINKIRNYFLLNIYIKLERQNISLPKVKKIVAESVQSVLNKVGNRNTHIVTDVDPV